MSSDEVQARGANGHVGRTLKGKWHLDALLGAGGVASVYAATHRNGNRVAIKILHSDLAMVPELRARFLNEGYAANTVGHAGAVQVIDDDQTDDGLVFLVMELLEGETLAQYAARLGGRLPPAEALAIADAMLVVIGAAHDKQILHRDLKPENVFLTRDGGVKVLDFGLARVRESSNRSGTQHGWTMGTPGFMPPEQARGEWSSVDARSDLWAVGATLFTALSGCPVHDDGRGHASVYLAATTVARSIATVAPELPCAVIEIVDRALAFGRDARWQSAAEMRAAIEKALEAFPERPAWTAGGPRVSSHGSEPRSRVTPITSMGTPPSARAAPVERLDNVKPVAIARDTYWVGKRDPRSIFHANPFLRIFRGADGSAYNLLVDPGSSSDFAVVSSKLGGLIGGPSKLSGLFVNHQDPDVGSSSAVISARHAPDAQILCSEATWRLIIHFNLPRDRFVDTDKLPRGITLPTGHTVLPVPSPFCHFRGAVMLYDPETRVLFSGDLFGGITALGAEGLWADESDWSGVRAFHQTYMPTSRALAAAVRTIRRLDPAPLVIAPQHGRLLRGAIIDRFLDRVERLPVGLDLIDEAGDGPDVMAAWNSVLRRVLHTAEMVLGADVEQVLENDENLRETIGWVQGRAEVRSAGRWTIGRVVDLLTAERSPTLANPIKLEAMFACEELELPSPELRIDGEDGERMSQG